MTPLDYLRPRLQRALHALGLAVSDDSLFAPHPRSPDVDVVITAALSSTVRQMRSGVQVAADIRDRLELDPSHVISAEVAEPGFINIVFAPRFFIEALRKETAEFRSKTPSDPGIGTHRAAVGLHTAIDRIDGLLRHARQIGIDVSTEHDLAPLHQSPLDVRLVRSTVTLLNVSRNGCTTTVLRIACERHVHAMEQFYYGCRVIAASEELRGARLVLLGLARTAAEHALPLLR